VSVTFRPELALIFGFHGVVERVEHPGIQVNQLALPAFKRIVELVRSHYEIVSLDDVAAALAGDRSLPAKSAVLTFDDGYRTVLELVDPLLQRLGAPYAVFAPSALVESGGRVPTFVMRAALEFTDRSSIVLPGRRRPFKLRTEDERAAAADSAAGAMRSLSQPEAEQVLAGLRSLLDEAEWRELDRRFPSEELLSWPELKLLAQRGVIVGSHTRDHAVLHGRQTIEEIVAQVVESKAEIEAQLGMPCRHFCYPHGAPRDVCRAAVVAVEEAGYSTGLMNVGGPVREGMTPQFLPRMPVTSTSPEAAVSARAFTSHSKWYAKIAEELDLG
jgi:peptidoglycan/xylan/chitin deacetylase (PgdA/CDA1 family)